MIILGLSNLCLAIDEQSSYRFCQNVQATSMRRRCCRARQANHSKFYGRLGRLNDFWAAGSFRRSRARRDLEDLRAAINHHAKEGLHRGVVRVLLPARGAPRTRWLTRSEAARLIWVCWRTRERQKRHRGSDKDKTLPTDRKPLLHLARIILIGLYSGSRAAAIAAASPHKGVGRSYVDLENGIFYRLPEGQTETRKRQPPSPFRPACWRTCGAGSTKGWSGVILCNGMAAACVRSRPRSEPPSAWLVFPAR